MHDAPPGWFGRNWKWFVPVGCLGVLLLVIAAGAVIGYGLHGLYEGSGVADPGKDALAAARAHPAVTQALGEPVERGLMMSGKVNVDNDGGNADMRYRIHGPRGEGWLHVVGRRERGRWHYDRMEAQLEGQPAPIDLRPMLPAPPAD